MHCTMAGTMASPSRRDHPLVGGPHLVGAVDVEGHPAGLALAQPLEPGGLDHHRIAELVGRPPPPRRPSSPGGTASSAARRGRAGRPRRRRRATPVGLGRARMSATQGPGLVELVRFVLGQRALRLGQPGAVVGHAPQHPGGPVRELEQRDAHRIRRRAARRWPRRGRWPPPAPAGCRPRRRTRPPGRWRRRPRDGARWPAGRRRRAARRRPGRPAPRRRPARSSRVRPRT